MADKAITFGKVELIDTGTLFEIKYDGTLRLTIDQASGDFAIGSGADGAISSFGNVWVNASTGVSEKLYVDGATRLKGSAVMSGGNGTFFQFPSMSTLNRPASPAAGYTIFNTTSGKLECYDGSVWNNLW
jgi:hypothetical protein